MAVSRIAALVRRMNQVTFLRFALVGLTSAGIYAVVVLLCQHALAMRPFASSLVGYAAAIPFNFLAQKMYTFMARGRLLREIAGYAVLQAFNMLLSAVVLSSTQWLTGSLALGIAFVVAVVPVATYVLMKTAVFASPKENKEWPDASILR